MIGRAAALALLLAAPGARPAAAQECRLALVLALDVSSSVDPEEDRLQREGLAQALLSPEVVEAFERAGPVAVHVFEWSGSRSQVNLLPGWAMVQGASDLGPVATAVAGSRRSRSNLPTAMGAALGHAADLLRDGPDCARRTVDVAGDGLNNESFPPETAYEVFPFDGVTVNALVVGDPTSAEGREEARRLVAWFQARVLRGPGAFSLVAEGYADYARAMRLKLLRELEVPAVSGAERRGAPGAG